MRTSTIVWIIVAVIVIGGGIYWFTMSSNAQSPSSTQTTTTPQSTAVLNLGSNAQLGNFLVATNGMTLYTYASDTTGVSNCTGTCATEWPPYTVSSTADLSAANITGTIGTITRADGTLQVTYNGMPLYFFVQDNAPGDATGNGDDGFAVATEGGQPSTSTQSQTTPAAQAQAPAAAPTQTPAQTPAAQPTTQPAAPSYNY